MEELCKRNCLHYVRNDKGILKQKLKIYTILFIFCSLLMKLKEDLLMYIPSHQSYVRIGTRTLITRLPMSSQQ